MEDKLVDIAEEHNKELKRVSLRELFDELAAVEPAKKPGENNNNKEKV